MQKIGLSVPPDSDMQNSDMQKGSDRFARKSTIGSGIAAFRIDRFLAMDAIVFLDGKGKAQRVPGNCYKQVLNELSNENSAGTESSRLSGFSLSLPRLDEFRNV